MTQLVELASDPTRDEPVVDVDLADLAEGVAARIQRRTGRRTLVVHDGHGTVPGRPAMLERAIANLVDNAQKYSAPAEPIEVHTTPNSVVVIDRGPGIAAPDRHRMFERFWRADSVRNQPGSGLGLAIVRQIVTRHDGEILVESEPGQGSRIGFRLPAPDA
jgi:two-component system sensor histidine kinase MprB